MLGYDGQVVAAMAISAPTSQLSREMLPEIATLVIGIAAEASTRLGSTAA